MNELSYADQRAQEQTELLRQTLRDLPTFCTDYFRAIEPTTSALTRLAYARDLRLFFHFLSNEIPLFGGKTPDQWTLEDLNAITATHIEQFLDYLNLYINNKEKKESNSDLGKMRKLSALRSFFRYFYKRERISANVSELVDMPKRHEKPILRLEIDEMARLLDEAETGEKLSPRQQKYHQRTKLRDLAMLTLFLGTGIRVSECVGLNISDLDFEVNGFMVTRKGGNQAILYFPDEVAEVLKEYLAQRKEIEALPGHTEALFLSLQRKRMTVRAVENMVKKYALLAAPLKRKLSPHKLRSTFGTNLYHETGDIYLVADVLGHSDVNTTRRHYAAMSDDKRRLAAKSVVLRGHESPDKDIHDDFKNPGID